MCGAFGPTDALGPQTRSGHNCCAILLFRAFALDLGMDYYNNSASTQCKSAARGRKGVTRLNEPEKKAGPEGPGPFWLRLEPNPTVRP